MNDIKENFEEFGEDVEEMVEKLGSTAADATSDVRAAAQLLGQEVKAGFERIARQL